MRSWIRPILVILFALTLAISEESGEPGMSHAAPLPSVIYKSGHITSDETWTSGNVYVIDGDLAVDAGATLTINAGTVVKLKSSYIELAVDGTLLANGTPGYRVYFTSFKDDTVGGNTDGAAESPDPGDWDRIHFRDGSYGTLSYVEFRYGGDLGDYGMLHTDAASVSVDHGTFVYSDYVAISSHAGYEVTLSGMSSSDFMDNRYNGLGIRGGSLNTDATWDETEVAYVLLDDLTVAAGVTLTWGPGVVIKPRLYYYELEVLGTLNANGTSGSPVYVTSVQDDTVGGNTDGAAELPEAGDWDRLYFRNGSQGALSYVELRYGGDYGEYGMLHTDAASVSVDHSTFVYSDYVVISSHAGHEVTLSGMSSSDFTDNRYNGLGIRGGSLNTDATWDETEVAYVLLDDLTVAAGVTLTWGPGVVIKPRLYYYELEVLGTLNANGTSGSPVYVTSLRDDTVGGNTDGAAELPEAGDWDRLYFRNGSQGALSYVELRYGGDYGEYGMLHTDAASVSVDHGTFVYSDYVAISSHAGHEVTLSGMSSSDFTDNRYNGLGIRGGSLNTDATWDETEVATILLDDLTVAAGVTLTWGPGVVIKPRLYYYELEVLGTLNANGTSGSPVYVTSLRDDTVGGNTDGAAEAPGVEDWERIYFRDGSDGTLSYVEFRYGGDYSYGAVHVQNGSPTMDHCTFHHNAHGVYSSGTSANPVIHNSEIYANARYGVYNAESGHWIDATNNWWGSNFGPHDPSSADGLYNDNPAGDRVSDYVQYVPWTGTTPIRVYLPAVIR